MGFLAPGFSYDKYLIAYGASALKGKFPYEWVDSLAKLDVDHLPPHEPFFSELKGKNISDEDYGYCKQVWWSENMSTFRDFVEGYNNLDVVPFLEAIDKQCDFYKEQLVDMFKDGVSVHGLTLKYMFSTVEEEIFFSLFNDRNSDLYHLLKKNIVGGPSIVFNRYQEASITPMRQEDDFLKVCGGVVGFDANALYLWVLSQDMPTGSYIRRQLENGFKPEKTNVYGRMAYECLEFIAAKKGVKIQHQFNGREKQGMGRLP